MARQKASTTRAEASWPTLKGINSLILTLTHSNINLLPRLEPCFYGSYLECPSKGMCSEAGLLEGWLAHRDAVHQWVHPLKGSELYVILGAGTRSRKAGHWGCDMEENVFPWFPSPPFTGCHDVEKLSSAQVLPLCPLLFPSCHGASWLWAETSLPLSGGCREFVSQQVESD